ncbi:hypothetical protein B0T19DRAFT_420567 [Cercophora scortea]|uniref:Uncharacterized protein n=1 Tax=Cercophora scortea TaxID=314031 RepID=A0AAE0IL19_9PEZI|nr:hypothetical protein B0T19DRAFT_420567 [Cercophora scortea]
MDSAISRFTALLFAGSQENTVALAALNFDFSLYKVQAPVEFSALGSSLSNERRQQAEGGSHHVTARKLGALFRSKLPAVPSLIKAYGERVSEIAESTVKDPQKLAQSSLLGDKLGIDGTSIWAAATSGSEALCVQLLACVLARFWAPQEATSIWVEIVDSRKRELSAGDGDFDFPALAAMQATLSRDQLAEWDASARAWLRTADKSMSKQQTQLRLIVDNLGVAVNNTQDTYESVMDAWFESMKIVDSLVAGMPQAIHNGAALVGLSSWHIYPDMMVYINGAKEINQNDPLVKSGGLLTVGLQGSPDSDKGVCWSLPLAKLRFYGDPVTVTRTLDSTNQRVSLEQLMIVILGCLASLLPDYSGDRAATICEYYTKLWEKIKAAAGTKSNAEQIRWIKYLAAAATTLSTLRGKEKISARRLFEFGIRRCSAFLSGSDSGLLTWDIQTLGLSRPETILSLLDGQREAQISFIRQVAQEFAGPQANKRRDYIIMWCQDQKYWWATCFPDPQNGKKYYRWHDRTALRQSDTKSAEHTDEMPENLGWEVHNEGGGSFKVVWRPLAEARAAAYKAGKPNDVLAQMFPVGQSVSVTEVETRWEIPFWGGRLLGDFDTLRIQVLELDRGSIWLADKKKPTMKDYHLDTDDILRLLETAPLNFARFTSPRIEPLWLLGCMAELYESLGTATISLEAITGRICDQIWAQSLWKHQVYPDDKIEKGSGDDVFRSHLRMPKNIAFACIAMMETGDQDLDPNQLSNVMAMAIGDSIYASACLSSDPYDLRVKDLIRVLGNVGKPGVSLLIPPPSPRILKLKTNNWNVVTHEPWDGSSQVGLFNKTSLHLWLTEYRVPYVVEHQGARDIQTFFQEAAVSIYDNGTWFGDIDIEKAVTMNLLVTRTPEACPHGVLPMGDPADWEAVGKEKRKKKKKAKAKAKAIANNSTGEVAGDFQNRIRTVENWYELLDKPSNPVIARTRGNWMARLAFTALSSQLGYQTKMLPVNRCEKGCFSDVKFMNSLVEEGEVIVD